MDSSYALGLLAAGALLASRERVKKRRCRRPRLILHFDVNKTITMVDSVQKKKSEDLVNDMIACSSWGFAQDGKWVWNGADPSPSCRDPRCCTYSKFLSKIYPAKGDKAEKKKIKVMRKNMRSTFTNSGCVGEGLADFHAGLMKNLKIPTHVAHTDAARAAGLQAGDRLLVDAFFQLLMHLQRTSRSFNIVLRTFGADIEDVVAELNAFCEGRHPLYPGGVKMDGSQGGPDYRVVLKNTKAAGTFYRDANIGIVLIMGIIFSKSVER